jgi:hypothetical protein
VESSLSQHCEAVGAAINSGDIGQTVTAVQQLILRYYDNVRGQADESFESAKRVARWGFVLLAATIAYVMFMDLLPHIWVGIRCSGPPEDAYQRARVGAENQKNIPMREPEPAEMN